jgi:phage terminase large subunit
MKDFLDILNIYRLNDYFKYNKSKNTLICKETKTKIEFIGLDKVLDIQGLKSNYWVLDEAIQIEWNIFQQLILRLTNPSQDKKQNQVFILYNPSDKTHWILKNIIEKRTDFQLIKSTYKDNHFLPEESITEIEELKFTDHDAWLVYGKGDWADVRGAVFKNWSTYETLDEREVDEVYYGVDWGFKNDFTTCIKVSVKKKQKEIYCEELIFQVGLTNPDIHNLLCADERIDFKDHIVADNSELKSVEEFNRLGWRNFQSVEKGKGSIAFGIDILNRYKIFIKSDSSYLIEEFENYKWLENKNNVITNVPVDKWNHGIDAIRYVARTWLGEEERSGGFRIFQIGRK